MSSILDQIMQQEGGDNIRSLSKMLGTGEQETEKATGAAVTALLGGLSRNAASTDGAESLSNALAKDHDGSMLGSLQSGLGQLTGGGGEGILANCRYISGSADDAEDLAQDVFAGFYARRVLRIGEPIEVARVGGVLEAITPTHAQIRTDTQVVTVANARLLDDVTRQS